MNFRHLSRENLLVAKLKNLSLWDNNCPKLYLFKMITSLTAVLLKSPIRFLRRIRFKRNAVTTFNVSSDWRYRQKCSTCSSLQRRTIIFNRRALCILYRIHFLNTVSHSINSIYYKKTCHWLFQQKPFLWFLFKWHNLFASYYVS